MDDHLFQELITPAKTKIVMLVMDGLGGLPLHPGGKTELETANTPNLDSLAAVSALGLSVPAGAGITVESGPGHLALFGYDPFKYRIGRGVLEAVGVGMELGAEDIAVRGNYCTMDADGVVTDRRAGRIPSDASRELSRRLSTRIEDVDILVETVREHRLAIILRGPGLSAEVTDSDPQKDGYHPRLIRPLQPGAEKMSRIVNRFVERSRQILATCDPKSPANMILLRGFDRYPSYPSFPIKYGLRAAAIATHSTYRGIAQLVGMHILRFEGTSIAEEISQLEKNWNDFDFFYLHVKYTDLAGEDGDFDRKVRLIEEVDYSLPRLKKLDPEVIIVTGDHSTPAVLRGHSWHPVPTLVYGKYVGADGIAEFGERACLQGSLGRFPATDLMPLALANAGRILKYSG